MGKIKCLLMLLLIPLLPGCIDNQFEISSQVEAEIVGSTVSCIGLKYQINHFMFLTDACDLNIAEIEYFKGKKKITIDILIDANDMDGRDRVFITQYFGGKQLGEKQKKVDTSMWDLAKKQNEIDGFIWKEYNDIEYLNGITPAELQALKSEGKVEEKEDKSVAEKKTQEGKKDL